MCTAHAKALGHTKPTRTEEEKRQMQLEKVTKMREAKKAKQGQPKSDKTEIGIPTSEEKQPIVAGLIKEKVVREAIDHPKHYGGADNPYEAIKVIEAWELGFHLGNVIKYVSRAGKKGSDLEDLKKAAWYLQREIEMRA